MTRALDNQRTAILDRFNRAIGGPDHPKNRLGSVMWSRILLTRFAYATVWTSAFLQLATSDCLGKDIPATQPGLGLLSASSRIAVVFESSEATVSRAESMKHFLTDMVLKGAGSRALINVIAYGDSGYRRLGDTAITAREISVPQIDSFFAKLKFAGEGDYFESAIATALAEGPDLLIVIECNALDKKVTSSAFQAELLRKKVIVWDVSSKTAPTNAVKLLLDQTHGAFSVLPTDAPISNAQVPDDSQIRSEPNDSNGSLLGENGKAKTVVFLCDASGSMLNVFGQLKNELKTSIGKLKAEQSFNVIFFSDDMVYPLGQKSLLMAVTANKKKAIDFIDSAVAAGGTQPITAIKFALSQKPDLLFILTDGFDQTASSDAVISAFSENNRERKTKVNCIYLESDQDPKLEFVLKRIAHDNGGIFKKVEKSKL